MHNQSWDTNEQNHQVPNAFISLKEVQICALYQKITIVASIQPIQLWAFWTLFLHHPNHKNCHSSPSSIEQKKQIQIHRKNINFSDVYDINPYFGGNCSDKSGQQRRIKSSNRQLLHQKLRTQSRRRIQCRFKERAQQSKSSRCGKARCKCTAICIGWQEKEGATKESDKEKEEESHKKEEEEDNDEEEEEESDKEEENDKKEEDNKKKESAKTQSDKKEKESAKTQSNKTEKESNEEKIEKVIVDGMLIKIIVIVHLYLFVL